VPGLHRRQRPMPGFGSTGGVLDEADGSTDGVLVAADGLIDGVPAAEVDGSTGGDALDVFACPRKFIGL
jgi:hypothetical protein